MGEKYVAETLDVAKADIAEIMRLSNAVQERPGFGFEDDLDESITEAVRRFRERLEEIKEAGTRNAGQGNLELE